MEKTCCHIDHIILFMQSWWKCLHLFFNLYFPNWAFSCNIHKHR